MKYNYCNMRSISSIRGGIRPYYLVLVAAMLLGLAVSLFFIYNDNEKSVKDDIIRSALETIAQDGGAIQETPTSAAKILVSAILEWDLDAVEEAVAQLRLGLSLTDARLLAHLARDDRLSEQQQILTLEIIGETGSLETVDVLLDVTHDTQLDDEIRGTALVAIGEIFKRNKPNSGTSVLSPFVFDERTELRRSAVNALAIQAHNDSVDILIRALDDQSVVVRARAAIALGFIGNEIAVPKLIERSQADPSLFEYVIALGKFKDQRAVSYLVTVAIGKREDPRTEFAIAALGEIGDENGIQALSTVLASEDEYLASAASRSLGKIGGPQAWQTLDAARGRTWTDSYARSLYQQALEQASR